MKRVLSIQDLSCIGKCSLGIALPVLSAMGVECAALPTAVLSTHTAFDGFVSKDLTPLLASFAAHWKQLGIGFDTIYSGYLASDEQIGLVCELYRQFGAEQTLFFVDPVMADHGRLYAGFDADFPEKMRVLCAAADIITPNITEACLLTGTPYLEQYNESYIRLLLERLLDLGAKTAILTGIRLGSRQMGVAAMEHGGNYSVSLTEYIPSVFHGTGDLFASTCAGALTLGYSTASAIALATDYVVYTIRRTAADPDARWYGVNFEVTLPYLIEQLSLLPPQEEPK